MRFCYWVDSKNSDNLTHALKQKFHVNCTTKEGYFTRIMIL